MQLFTDCRGWHLTFLTMWVLIISSFDKPQIRQKALAMRDCMIEAERKGLSSRLVGYASSLPVVGDQIVSGFFPIKSEIDLRPLMAVLESSGTQLCLPVVLDRETIVFRRYDSSSQLIETGFGTRGPDENAQVVDPDVMLIPLAAYDNHGNRIGYGAGHYDRAISRLHAKGVRPCLIGAAFSCQCVADIQAEIHDVPLDAILTENGLHYFNIRS